MNQYNNTQQPHYDFRQHTPGPPQPSWQANSPRRGWEDPRLQQPAQAGTSVASPYDPNTFNSSASSHLPPPVPNPPLPARPNQANPSYALPVSHHDPATWGVRYNQQQQQQQQQNLLHQQDEVRPPLPPRPSSAVGGQYSGWQESTSNVQNPPIPPPRPPQYAVPSQISQPVQNQYYPHEQYSHQAPSHHYDPPASNWPVNQQHNAPTAPSWNQVQGSNDGPVSPVDSIHNRWSVSGSAGNISKPNYGLNQIYGHTQPPGPSADMSPYAVPQATPSALGPGGPSDWQHYSHTEQHHDDEHQYHQAHMSDTNQGFVGTPEQMTTRPMHQSTDLVPPPPMTPPPLRASDNNQTQNNYFNAASGALASAVGAQAGPYSSRPRPESESSASSISLPTRAGTIDSVIQAWNSPQTHSDAEATEDKRKTLTQNMFSPQALQKPSLPISQPIETASSETQTDFPPIVKTETKIETRVETREVDPYADIKDEYRTSLNRFVSMLRQESSASNETEKLKVVHEFMNRELKFRGALYNKDAPQLVPLDELNRLRDESTRIGLEKARLEDELNKLRAAQEKSEGEHKTLQQEHNNLREEHKKLTDSARHPSLAMVIPEPVTKPPSTIDTGGPKWQLPPRVSSLTTNMNPASSASKDDSFVVVNNDGEDTEYSPGGRPRIAPLRTQAAKEFSQPSAGERQQQNGEHQEGQKVPSPSSNAPMTLEDYVMPDRASPGWDAPIVVGPEDMPRPTSTIAEPPSPAPTVTPIHFQPARPVYTPFRYNEASNLVTPIQTSAQPANEAYAKLRHDQVMESGRILSAETPLISITEAPDRQQTETPTRAKQQQEEAFIGLLRKQSQAIRKGSPSPASASTLPPRSGTPHVRRASIPPLTKTMNSVRSLLPKSIQSITSTGTAHPKILSILVSLDNISEDFGFIRNTVLSWDKQNRQIRRKLDDERASRESESQARIDELFHDNEIGYADIAGLEEGFKVEEASKKYKEDMDELESFSTNVFEVVTGRLESELNELGKLRTSAIDLLDLKSASSSKRIRMAAAGPGVDTDAVPLSESMDLVLQIFDKIEVRHTKIAEAQFERERRRKRLELGVLYTNGDSVGIKKLEKDFDKAQALQVLAESRKRDERANKLMDSFDRAVVRGLAENQDWVDDVLNKTSLLRDLIFGSESNGPAGQERENLLYGEEGVKELMTSLQQVVSMVLQDSTALVTMSNKADKILNEADFAIGLSEAHIAQSNEKDFEKLHTEKSKEDSKLAEEFEGRINGITRGPEEISALVREMRDWIGGDKEHRSRIEKALQEAKKRNPSVSGPSYV